MRRTEVERAALDAALRAAELCVVRAEPAAKPDADLVRKDLLGRPHLFERFGIQNLLQLSDEELVRKDGELDQRTRAPARP